MIQRQALSLLLEDARHLPVLGLIGPRQVGKTTLARTIQSFLSKEVRYFDLELEADAALMAHPTAFLQQHVNACIIIDEVQRAPHLFPLLRALVDQQRDPARFLLLGSASPALLRNTSESLAGRIAYTELMPFSLLELEGHLSQQQHWFRGGFPDAALASGDAVAGRWLENYLRTFLERDVRMMGYEVAVPALSRLLQMLASIHGNLLNVADLSRSTGISQATIRHYLDILEGAFLISRLQPWFANTTKRLIKSPKLYIRDSGLLHRLARISSAEALQAHILAGASWEGYVIEEIRKATQQRCEYYFYRTQRGAEADLLLITPHGKKALIEIKISAAPTLSRGFYEVREDLTPDYSYVVTPEGHTYLREDGVQVIPLASFLRDILPVLAPLF